MKSPFETGSSTVDRMSRLQISGNVIPISWYQTIRKSTGKPNLTAIVILSDIVYWYRAVEVRDEMTGQLIGLKKKFRSDILQRSYQQIAEQFGITKRDATNAIVELEKMGVVRRVFRMQEINGQMYSNVLFLDLNVDVLEKLTYPERAEEEAPEAKGRCPPGVSPKSGRGAAEIGERVSQKSGGGVTEIGERVSLKSGRGVTEMRETYTKNTTEEYSTKNSYPSYQETERLVKEQISYTALKHDYPFDERIDELLGIMVEVLDSGAEVIRVNREDKPAKAVKAQFEKISKQHIEFVLRCMSESSTRARNIRALLITALYNSVNTISSYYGNLVQYHMANGATEGSREPGKKVEE